MYALYLKKCLNNIQCLLVILLLCILAIQNANCANSKKVLIPIKKTPVDKNASTSKPLGKIPLSADKNKIHVFQIYNDYGIRNEDEICTSIDGGKTSMIWGYGVCKHVVEQMKYENFIMGVHCEKVDMIEYYYKHAEKLKIMKKKEEEIKAYHQLVNCGYITIEGYKKTILKFIYTAHAHKNYYYVFTREYNIAYQPERETQLEACLKIDVQDSDFNVELKKTNNEYEADAMFGIYGMGKFSSRAKPSGHVCSRKNVVGPIFGETICPIAFEKSGNEPSTLESVCSSIKIKRDIEGICKNCPKETKKELLAARCTADSRGYPISIMVINTPVNGLYYVAKESSRNNDQWYIISVIQTEDDIVYEKETQEELARIRKYVVNLRKPVKIKKFLSGNSKNQTRN